MRNADDTLPRDPAGALVTYAWPGGYPVYYVERDEFRDESIVCPDCARITDEDEDRDEVITGADANWEDPELYCDACGERIESAYAEPEIPAGEDEAPQD